MTRYDPKQDTQAGRALLEKLRRFCLALPGTTETPTWGHPNWRVDDKIFAAYGLYQSRPSLGTKQTLDDQLALIADPRFFVSPYVGKHGWTSVWLDQPVECGRLEELLVRSYRLIATKERLANFAGGPEPTTRRRPSPPGSSKKQASGRSTGPGPSRSKTKRSALSDSGRKHPQPRRPTSRR
jgi:predicted DNA-binding protein (MmcQ/YjbR family)